MSKDNLCRTFSKKQIKTLSWWCDNSRYKDYDGIICDGAIRSGKTLSMSLSFVFWAFYRFDTRSFAICGKTITSLKRNVILPMMPILENAGFSCKLYHSQNYLQISRDGRENKFFLFGGRDESSSSLIQGVTLAGVLLDEVVLMPRSFVQQALARCSVQGSKLWFNCNPGNPGNWFYQEYIKEAKQKNLLYLHFKMEDNPSLTPQIRKRYERLYSGTFYQRFVQGKWVAAQGLVYPMFRKSEHVMPMPCKREEFIKYYVSCDYGIVNPASFGLWGLWGDIWYRIDEYYHDSKAQGCQRTDEEYYNALQDICEGLDIEAVIVDPSASSFIECIKRHGKFRTVRADNDVLAGIRNVSEALKQKKIAFSTACVSSVREFSLYMWDDNQKRDVPIKDNDHAMDDIRYFVMTVLNERENGFYAFFKDRE